MRRGRKATRHGGVVRLTGLAAIILVTLTASCSGSDDPATPTTTGPPTTAAPTTTTTLPEGERLYVFSLGVGDCFDRRNETDEEGELIVATYRIDCALAHDNEIFAASEHDAPAGERYPGDDDVTRVANEFCFSQFETYVGEEYELSELEVGKLVPSVDSWEDEGDRDIVCYVFDMGGAKLTGSVQGSAR